MTVVTVLTVSWRGYPGLHLKLELVAEPCLWVCSAKNFRKLYNYDASPFLRNRNFIC
jgi:hypothetical protein